MAPKVLLATTCRWFSAARLAIALAEAGCRVELLCPNGHPAETISVISRFYPYHAFAPIRCFRSALRSAEPDAVVACDDLAAIQLHRLYEAEHARGPAGAALCRLIERSFGNPASFPVVDSRSRLMALAQEAGVRTPETEAVESAEQLHAWIARHGLPAVLKADGTSGGEGVRIIRTAEEAEWAFHRIYAPPLFARAVKRALADRDRTLLEPWLLRRKPLVSVQRYIEGVDATLSLVCWRGEVLATVGVGVIETLGARGPASVVRLMTNPAMGTAGLHIVQRLGLSGFYGFDFMVEKQTGVAYLIEMNARSTQTCHLALGPEHDLAAAFRAALAGEPVAERPPVTTGCHVTLFPQEWQNNPASEHFRNGYHDVPWQEPELVRACIDSRREREGIAARLVKIYKQMPWYRE